MDTKKGIPPLTESKCCPPLSAAKRPHYLKLDPCYSHHLVHIQEGNKQMKDDSHHLSYTHFENLLNPSGLICAVLQATGKILWGCCVCLPCVTQVLKRLSSYQKTVLGYIIEIGPSFPYLSPSDQPEVNASYEQ